MEEIGGMLVFITLVGLVAMIGYGFGMNNIKEDCAAGKIILIKDKPYTCATRELK
jgi:hypothetical protein